MTLSEMKDLVIKGVSIPNYVSDVVVPNMSYYYNDYSSDLNVTKRIKCPLHNENTPSFRYYEETNSYFCWGCNSGGDIINLHRQFMSIEMSEDISFYDAVLFLYKRFVEGKEVSIGSEKRKKVNVLNSNVDLMLLKRELNKYELILINVEDINVRKSMYELMDDLEQLCGMNLCSVKDAKESLIEAFNK